ncbi:MAG: polysaccharide biosynthesis C-terminal domain-containing protein [Muribaculaceae bacterium]|nr:polysaccharide biosynthesis C-terminal domain-containing protein [Muribaculaceae bacterium]
MANLKSLAKDTAIYGLSSIVGRFLNYLLVPLYTAKMSAASGDYGIVTNVYAYTALLLAVLTYGMETTFFRFANKSEEDPRRVYSTTLLTVGMTSLLFVALVWLNIGWIAPAMGLAYTAHPDYIVVMAAVVALDAFQAIVFAYLRYKKRPLKFAALKLLFIFANIGLNLLYFVVLPALYKSHPDAVGAIYSPTVGVGYVFYLNLACTLLVMVCMWGELREASWCWDRQLLRRMMGYSWPILILSVAGVINQSASQIIFPMVHPGGEVEKASQLGIYGAAIKIAMIMALITQAFRYAYEPFVFGGNRNKDDEQESKRTQALAMKYFVVFTLIAYLAVLAGIDVLKNIIAPDYWEGLRVVPIVMAAEIMMGIYFNLSFWYKLTDRTLWGAVFSGIGCLVLVAVNVVFVPQYGYMACAWAGVAAYGTCMLLSYFTGQHYYPMPYPLRDIALYVVVTAVLSAAALWVDTGNTWLNLAVRTVLLLLLVVMVIRREQLTPMLARIPVLGRLFH